MGKTGQPISEEERRGKSIKHILHYGVKMMIRRDIGGSDNIENHAEKLGQELRGKTYQEAGQLVADKIEQSLKGAKERQRRSIEEFEHRNAKLEACYKILLKGSLNSSAAAALATAAISDYLYGTTAQAPTSDTHIL